MGGPEPEGWLLYAAVDGGFDYRFELVGRPVRVCSVDLGQEWRGIEEGLKGLVGVGGWSSIKRRRRLRRTVVLGSLPQGTRCVKQSSHSVMSSLRIQRPLPETLPWRDPEENHCRATAR